MCEIFWSVIPQMNLVSLHLPYFLHITCFLEDLAFSVDGMVQKECCPAGLERSDIITYLHFSLGQQVVQLALISNGFLFNTVHSSFEKLQRLPKKWWIVMNSMTEVGPGDWPTHKPINYMTIQSGFWMKWPDRFLFWHSLKLPEWWVDSVEISLLFFHFITVTVPHRREISCPGVTCVGDRVLQMFPVTPQCSAETSSSGQQLCGQRNACAKAVHIKRKALVKPFPHQLHD